MSDEMLLPDPIVAHCIWCPHKVQGFDPIDVHDRMEQHYGSSKHRSQIAAAVFEMIR